MIRKQLEQYLEAAGFYSLPTSLKELSALVKVENNLINVLQIIDYPRNLYLSFEQYLEIKEAVKTIFQEKGISEIHIMTVILYEDLEKARQLVEDDRFCWFINKETREFIIDANRVEDFYGLKGLLTDFLTNYKEEPDVNENFGQEVVPRKGQGKFGEYVTQTPKVTITLVALNIIIFILCVINGQQLYTLGEIGLNYIEQGEYYRLISACFLHGDVDHIFSNMLLLYCLGAMIEQSMGKVRFLSIYMISGILGNVVSCLYEYISGVRFVSIGASGAVFGLIGAILILVIKGDKTMKITLPRIVLLIIYSVYSSFVGENINAAAHIGGLLVGFITAGLSYAGLALKNKS